ncbi:hypothetical protein GY45DRAFT_1371069 [Cubamyces sp. BRFM 1775]|nr:hypothetical protein GY45DRAFT_1371069 [Cubamyces sp. BRFM 1775]
MSVMTATQHADDNERHYVASPPRTSASSRGDASSPHAYPYTQKPTAEKMDHWNFPKHTGTKLPHPTEWPNPTAPRDPARATSDPRHRVASEGGEFRHGSAFKVLAKPTRQSGPLYAYPNANPAVTSLGGKFASATATWGLNGAFSGTWSPPRTAPVTSAEPRGSAWTRARGQDDDKMDEDDEDGSSEDRERCALSSSRSSSSISRARLSSESLPQVPNRAPTLTESDILLGTSTGRLRPATFSPVAQRERAASWEGESVRLPPIRAFVPQRSSPDYSPHTCASSPPSKRPCVQLPSFPEYFEGSSRPSISASSVRRDTASPPPSPSPSAASFSTAAHSSGQTDTEPTDDEDVVMAEYKLDGRNSLRSTASRSAVAHHPIRANSPTRSSPPFQDVAAYSPSSSSSSSPSPDARPDDDTQQTQAPGRQAQRRRTRARPSEPAQKKYRFVASKLSTDVSQPSEPIASDELERGRSPAVRSGAKRKHAGSLSPSPASSEDIPLSTLLWVSPAAQACPEPSIEPERLPQLQPPSQQAPKTQPRPIVQAPVPPTDPPKRRGRPPRPAYDIESAAPIDPDSPEAKGQFPEYRFECKRGPLPCEFQGCGTMLTGKKSEMTTHLKAHFHAAGGRTLLCPWRVKQKDGRWEPCGQAFRDSANMGRHVTTRHAKTEEFQCGRCFRPFSRRDAALRHMKTMCSPDKQKKKEDKKKQEAQRKDYGVDIIVELDVDSDSEDQLQDDDEDDSGLYVE